MVRILLKNIPQINSLLNVPEEQVHHIVNVRRINIGEEVECIDYDNNFCRACVEEIGKNKVIIRVTGEKTTKEKLPNISLYAALLPEKKMDWIIQKCTEIGVTELVPILSEFCTAKFHIKNAEKKINRWNKIAEEAARQCGGVPMRVKKPQKFEETLQSDARIKIICEKSGKKLEKTTIFDKKHQKNDKIIVLIGPEGGFSEKEVKKAVNNGWHATSFHQNILRAETAAVVCCVLVQSKVQTKKLNL